MGDEITIKDFINQRFEDHQKYIDTKFEGLFDDINELKITKKNMVDNCVYKDVIKDTSTKVKKIDNELLPYRFFTKYKKVTAFLLIAYTIVMVFEVGNFIDNLKSDEHNKIKIENDINDNTINDITNDTYFYVT